MPVPRSVAQAHFFGVIAGGALKVKGFTQKQAKDSLRGQKLKKLPARSRRKKR